MLAKINENPDLQAMASAPVWSAPVLIEEPPLFVLLAEPQREGIAAGHLRARGVKPYLPLEPCMMRFGQRRLTRISFRPIFRGYVFADHAAENIDLHTLPGLRSAHPFLRIGPDVVVLNARDVLKLRKIEADLQEDTTEAPQPHCFKAGDKVRFADNLLFDDEEFEVIRVDESGRITIKWRLFGALREVPVNPSKLVPA